MNRVRVKELALVAVAGGLLAFEALGLRGALPTAMRSLAGEGVLDAVKAASRGAAVATASVLDGAGTSAADVAVGAAKGAARLFGTVTPPSRASRCLRVTTRAQGGSTLTVVGRRPDRGHAPAIGGGARRAYAPTHHPSTD